METRDLSDEELLRGLQNHLHLRSRIPALRELAQGTNSELQRAADAQEWLIQEVRALDQKTLQACALSPVQHSQEEVHRRTGGIAGVKN
jgi:hypothetical protein